MARVAGQVRAARKKKFSAINAAGYGPTIFIGDQRERERENRRSTGPTLAPASGARVVRLRNNADRGVIVAPRLTARCTAILANISIVRGQQPCHVAFEYLRSPTTD